MDFHFNTGMSLAVFHSIINNMLTQLTLAGSLSEEAIASIRHQALLALEPWKQQCSGSPDREEMLQGAQRRYADLFDGLGELAREVRKES